MANSSHKLKNAFEGALAGGGDPATSPLYIFGPFIKMIAAAGVARVTFGSSIWLVIITIATASSVYRFVIQWITDGSGGSGMSEEEFGGWAVKVDAAITFIEYTLTFLVSMSAMITFIADRFPTLNTFFLGFQYRVFVAILLSFLIGWLVNRGPKMAAAAFGPATAGILFLLWLMIFETIYKMGFQLPSLSIQAFKPPYLRFTINGYVRILAVMTGIEVFANLVPAYSGTSKEKSQKAFRSLLIVMFTSAATMLIIGPAIFSLSDPAINEISLFTQTMDILLPQPLAYLGSFIGVFVLMSACAASAQGLQNLSMGLTHRQYVPSAFGAQNKFEVADKPVWLQVLVISISFLLFGTQEEIYLGLYAAGVFVILSLTGWAVTKRLMRGLKENFSWKKIGVITATGISAILTTSATIVIFIERFSEGVWVYFILVPVFYLSFTYFHTRLIPATQFE
ncbi:MAG: APC family permease [Anaerolineaceae bacterium]|nr:APC family permease [Anaerolineaceae bacterium]